MHHFIWPVVSMVLGAVAFFTGRYVVAKRARKAAALDAFYLRLNEYLGTIMSQGYNVSVDGGFLYITNPKTRDTVFKGPLSILRIDTLEASLTLPKIE